MYIRPAFSSATCNKKKKDLFAWMLIGGGQGHEKIILHICDMQQTLAGELPLATVVKPFSPCFYSR
jgi:hypothetical protein